MFQRIGLIRETKNAWEKRVALIPQDVQELIRNTSMQIFVQPSPLRIFPKNLYVEAGATIAENLSGCDVLIGIKEVKIPDLIANKIYMFFSHTIKGQSYNMPMLQKILDLKCTLIDYERIVNEKGQRLIFFSHHAGLSGMVDMFWAYAKRLESEGIKTPFLKVKQAFHYKSLTEIKNEFQKIADEIRTNGLAREILPFVVGITGYGHVSKGAQEILDILPVEEISPDNLLKMSEEKKLNPFTIYKVVFKETDMVRQVSTNQKFNLQDYYDYPEKYAADFSRFLSHITILVNATFWSSRYPRHVTKEDIRKVYSSSSPKLKVIGDISCDIDGGIEITTHAVSPGNPVYVFDVKSGKTIDGVNGNGPVVMAVDNLPSELPKEASEYFSSVFKNLLPGLIQSDFPAQFENWNIPFPLKTAVIAFRGKLTPAYEYLKEYL